MNAQSGLSFAQRGDGGLGSGSGCALDRGETLSRHRMIASLQLSPVGVWEVDGVGGSLPRSRTVSSAQHRRTPLNGELADLNRILHKGQVLTCQEDEQNGEGNTVQKTEIK